MLYVRRRHDVEWWRDLNLPLRSIIQRNGRIVMDTPDWIESEEGKRIFQETAGKTTFSARKVIVDELRAAGDLDGEPTPTKRMTNFYEKGDKPLEIVTSRQWYLKNGGTDEKLNAELIARGKELNFHPDFMRVRYENWVHGLNGDWLISRQRFFGVPFPLWYPVKEDGTADYDHPITPSETVCRSTRPTMCRKATPRISVTCRAASPPSRTSWTPGPPRRSPRRS